MSKQAWVSNAIALIEADYHRSADTHLIPLPLPALPNLQLYLKDESTHPTGSLKHRLARSLFLYGLCNGRIHQNTTIIEASSGSTAISEAYFSRLLGLPFIAVIPNGTSQRKIDQITFYGGRCHLVDGPSIYAEAQRLADEINGHYMDQFTFAERATDWRGNNNIAESIYSQMEKEPNPVPSWVVVSAGTGGTSATIGRYIKYQGYNTQLCVADPANSVFYDHFNGNDVQPTPTSLIEGIGRPRVEPSFVKTVIDRMEKIPDEAALATVDVLQTLLNRKLGASTGTNVYAVFRLMSEMHKAGESGSIVSMICDSGERYLETYFNNDWRSANCDEAEIVKYTQQLQSFLTTGVLA